MRGTPWKFTIRASGLILKVVMDNVDSRNAVRGSEVGLGMISRRNSYMVIAGEGGDWNFYSVGEVHNWMNVNLDKWQDRTLRQLCVPASHDSGMSLVTSKTRLAAPTSIITQFNSVYDQLKNGIRYFDLRPVHHDGQWVSGHYTFVDQSPINSWQGGDGESIQSIIDQVNRFTSDHQELIVLSVSHVQILNDRGLFSPFQRDDFRAPNADEWKDLFDLFESFQQRWSKSTHDLTKVPLKEFIGPSTGPWQSAVILIFDDSVANLSNRAGMFPSTSWPWDSSEWQKPETDRLQDFLKTQASSSSSSSQANDAKPFSFSGCHTQSTTEAIASTLGQDDMSVLNLSEKPKNRVFTELFPACSEIVHPCSIAMDAIDSSDLTALCLAICERSRRLGA